MEKEELEKIYGEVLSTAEAIKKYEFTAFCAPIACVRRRTDKPERLNFSTIRDFTLNLLKIIQRK